MAWKFTFGTVFFLKKRIHKVWTQPWRSIFVKYRISFCIGLRIAISLMGDNIWFSGKFTPILSGRNEKVKNTRLLLVGKIRTLFLNCGPTPDPTMSRSSIIICLSRNLTGAQISECLWNPSDGLRMKNHLVSFVLAPASFSLNSSVNNAFFIFHFYCIDKTNNLRMKFDPKEVLLIIGTVWHTSAKRSSDVWTQALTGAGSSWTANWELPFSTKR